MNFVPAGRVLYGAGSDSLVTYFNCFVMPFIEDSREGIAEHRKSYGNYVTWWWSWN